MTQALGWLTYRDKLFYFNILYCFKRVKKAYPQKSHRLFLSIISLSVQVQCYDAF